MPTASTALLWLSALPLLALFLRLRSRGTRKRVNDLGINAAEIDALVEMRWLCRQRKEWQAADAIMTQLRKLGVHVDDTVTKSTWRLNCHDQIVTPAIAKTNRPLNPSRMRRRRAQKRQHHVRGKKVRAVEFVAWLMQHVGGMVTAKSDEHNPDFTGFHVWDVAGGRGEVGHFLSVEHGIQCTVVDSTPVQLSVHKTKQVIIRAQEWAKNEQLECDHEGLEQSKWLHPTVAVQTK